MKKNKRKSAEIWKGIRTLVNIKFSKLSSIKLLDEHNHLVADPEKIVNTFNNYFSTIGSKIEQKFLEYLVILKTTSIKKTMMVI